MRSTGRTSIIIIINASSLCALATTDESAIDTLSPWIHRPPLGAAPRESTPYILLARKLTKSVGSPIHLLARAVRARVVGYRHGGSSGTS